MTVRLGLQNVCFLICERFLSQNYQNYLTFKRSNATKISKYPQEPQISIVVFIYFDIAYSHAQMDNRSISSTSPFDGARVSTGSLQILIMDMNGGVGVYIWELRLSVDIKENFSGQDSSKCRPLT
jgi:hypothetical protein